jgi:hypothetical protein
MPHQTPHYGESVKRAQRLPLAVPVARNRTVSIQVGSSGLSFDLAHGYFAHGLAESIEDHAVAVKATAQRLL